MVSEDDDDLDSILEGLDDDDIVQVKSSVKKQNDDEETSETEEDEKAEVKKPEPVKPPMASPFKRKKTDVKKIVTDKSKTAIHGLISFFIIGDRHVSKARHAMIFSLFGFLFAIVIISIAIAYLSFNVPHLLTTKNISLSSLIVEIPEAPAPIILSKHNQTQPSDSTAIETIKYQKENTAHGDTSPFDFYKDTSLKSIPKNKKKIAIIIADIGLNSKRLTDVFKESPAHTTLAFSAYADIMKPEKTTDKTFENWLILPTERTDKAYDPGLFGIYNSRDITLNLNTLNALLNAKNNFAGFILPPYSAIPDNKEQYKEIVSRIYELGYGIADASFYSIAPEVLTRGLPNFPYFQVDIIIDSELTPQNINAAFKKLEIIADENNQSIGLMRSYPISLELYKYWANTLDDRDYILVPLSTLFKKSNITKLNDASHKTHHAASKETHHEDTVHRMDEPPAHHHAPQPHEVHDTSHDTTGNHH